MKKTSRLLGFGLVVGCTGANAGSDESSTETGATETAATTSETSGTTDVTGTSGTSTTTGGSGTTGETPGAPTPGMWRWNLVPGAFTNECGDGVQEIGMFRDKMWRVDEHTADGFAAVDWWADSVTCSVSRVDDRDDFACEATIPAILPGAGLAVPPAGTSVVSHTIIGTTNSPTTAVSRATMVLDCAGPECDPYAATWDITFPCTLSIDRTGTWVESMDEVACADEDTVQSSSGLAATVWLYNATPEPQRLYWIDQQGVRQFYAGLGGYRLHDQPTYATHAWVFTDVEDNCEHVVIAGENDGGAMTLP